MLLRLAAGKDAQPSAAVIDSRNRYTDVIDKDLLVPDFTSGFSQADLL